VFERLSNNTDFISIDKMLIIARAISEDSLFPEEDVYDIILDEEVACTRRLTKEHFFKIIEEIKKR
jgi:hypothetical protein